jgi:hypothetical protein
MSRPVLASLLLAAALGGALPATAATLLSDDFSDAGSGWPNMAATRDSDLGFAVYTDSGQYQLTPVKDDVFGFISAPKQAAGGDVAIESDMFLYAGIGAGAAGLGCRHQDHSNFYAFMVRGDAVLMILKVKHGEITSLAQGRVDALMPGTVDTRLSVECKGDTLRFGARGGKTITARDGDFAQGGSGVFVIGEKMAGTSVVFDNFELSTAGAR